MIQNDQMNPSLPVWCTCMRACVFAHPTANGQKKKRCTSAKNVFSFVLYACRFPFPVANLLPPFTFPLSFFIHLFIWRRRASLTQLFHLSFSPPLSVTCRVKTKTNKKSEEHGYEYQINTTFLQKQGASTALTECLIR